MKTTSALAIAVALALTAPAFAQSAGSTGASPSGTGSNTGSTASPSGNGAAGKMHNGMNEGRAGATDKSDLQTGGNSSGGDKTRSNGN